MLADRRRVEEGDDPEQSVLRSACSDIPLHRRRGARLDTDLRCIRAPSGRMCRRRWSEDRGRERCRRRPCRSRTRTQGAGGRWLRGSGRSARSRYSSCQLESPPRKPSKNVRYVALASQPRCALMALSRVSKINPTLGPADVWPAWPKPVAAGVGEIGRVVENIGARRAGPDVRVRAEVQPAADVTALCRRCGTPIRTVGKGRTSRSRCRPVPCRCRARTCSATSARGGCRPERTTGCCR